MLFGPCGNYDSGCSVMIFLPSYHYLDEPPYLPSGRDGLTEKKKKSTA
jgi:hypothetical protein